MREKVEGFLRQIKVFDCNFFKRRYGNRHDGGYVLLEDLCSMANTLYSYGIGYDVGFEMAFLEAYPKVITKLYDPSIDYPPKNHPRFVFAKEGIGLGWDGPRNVEDNAILKMDVEWHEWHGLGHMPVKELMRFSQMVIEFHILHVEPRAGLTPYFNSVYRSLTDSVNHELFTFYGEVMKKINSIFTCFHIHANNSLPEIEVEGFLFPPLIEMSFARNDLIGDTWPARAIFPMSGLDFRNKTDRPDIRSNWYPIIKGVKS